METDESWKGEGLIRKKPKDGRREASKLANILYHAQRRKMGLPPAGQKKHSAFMKTVLRGRDP